MTPPSANSAAANEPGLAWQAERLLIEVADALNTTLDFDTILLRIAELVRNVIPYEIFAIQLYNEKTQELRMRLQIGHDPEVEKIRVKLGQGVTGQAAQRREAVLVPDVTKFEHYINAHPKVRSELAVPLIMKNKLIGVIDIQSSETAFFTEEHRRLLSLVASRIAVSIENARLYTRLSKQAKTLQVLNEISQELTSILNLDQLLKRIGDLLVRVIDFQMFSILLLDEKGEKLQHRFSMRFKENIQLKHDIPIGEGLVGYSVSKGESVLVSDVDKDARYIKLNPETRSELVVPLVYKSKIIGVLDIEHTRRGYFTDDHRRTITTLAAQIAIAIENARLYERIAQEEQRMERDLAMAREVQNRLLPQSVPKLINGQLAAKFEPAQQLGGDMYDFLEYTAGRTGILIADVSGKGSPAALYAAVVNGLVRSLADVEPSPNEMLEALNIQLHDRRIESSFVSMIFAVWDDEHHVLQVSNSGLPRPFLCHIDKVTVVESTGLPLGLFEDVKYDELTIRMDAGDAILFFSDGIIDAENATGEIFGRPRIEQVLKSHCNSTAQQIVDAIFEAVHKFAGNTAAFDDETIVALKVKPESKKPEVARPKKTSPSLRKL